MVSVRSLRATIFERVSERTVWWGGAAVGLFLVTGLYAVASDVISQTVAAEVLWLFVLVGACLAVLAAFRGRGLVVSWLLVGAPVGGALSFYWRDRVTTDVTVVARPFSFEGEGALALWLPTAFLLGIVAFGVGRLLRWTTN